MTSWRNKTSLLFLFIFLTTFHPSEAGCPDYFKAAYMMHNLTKTIPIIETKDPNNKWECSLERKSLQDGTFCNILLNCFPKERQNCTRILPKCVGNPSRNVSYYQYMCTLASDLKISSDVCEHYDATCSFFPRDSHIVNDSTTSTPTTLPERTTAALPLSTTSLQKSATTNVTSANADGSSEQVSGDDSTESFCLKMVCIFLLVLCLTVIVVCLWLYRQWRRVVQLLRTFTERSSGPVMLTAVELSKSQPQANGEKSEATSLMQTETSVNAPHVRNSSLY